MNNYSTFYLSEIQNGGQDAHPTRVLAFIPVPHLPGICCIGGGWKWPFSLEWVLFDAETVTVVTENNFRLFVTEVEEDEPPMDSGFWLSIGWWSDKHEYLLCCDRNHSHYGVVLDGHDSHPWLNGVEFGGCYPMAKSFLEWLHLHGGS